MTEAKSKVAAKTQIVAKADQVAPAAPLGAIDTFDPNKVLKMAQEAANALNNVIKQKKKPVIINGEQYLEFEDWQTLGWFYGVTVGTIWTKEIWRDGKLIGFKAKARAWRNGVRVSSAEATCTREEEKISKRMGGVIYPWKDKPEFQLKSMAQTRACAKALRNVLAWVAVLAGYRPTPAEEMTGVETNGGQRRVSHRRRSPANPGSDSVSEAQRKAIFAIGQKMGYSSDEIKERVKKKFGLKSFSQLSKKQASEVISAGAEYLANQRKPKKEEQNVKASDPVADYLKWEKSQS